MGEKEKAIRKEAKHTILIGDVHGCAKELNKLLKAIRPNPEKQRIIFIGDLIRKGPSSLKVYLKMKELGATSILGNHEWSIKEQVAGREAMRPSFNEVKKEFGKHFDDFVSDIQTWPAYLEEKDFIAVHAGLMPDRPLSKTDELSLVTMRTWDGKGEDLQNPDNPPWFEFYKKDRLVIFGHWAALRGIKRKNIIGLDTGCVYGGKLSALILPERKIVSISAKKVYCQVS